MAGVRIELFPNYYKVSNVQEDFLTSRKRHFNREKYSFYTVHTPWTIRTRDENQDSGNLLLDKLVHRN